MNWSAILLGDGDLKFPIYKKHRLTPTHMEIKFSLGYRTPSPFTELGVRDSNFKKIID